MSLPFPSSLVSHQFFFFVLLSKMYVSLCLLSCFIQSLFLYSSLTLHLCTLKLIQTLRRKLYHSPVLLIFSTHRNSSHIFSRHCRFHQNSQTEKDEGMKREKRTDVLFLSKESRKRGEFIYWKRGREDGYFGWKKTWVWIQRDVYEKERKSTDKKFRGRSE